MTTGYTGSYAVNGVNLITPPTYGDWDSRAMLGVDGNNRPIYPTVRSFELSFETLTIESLKQLIDAQLASQTGTIVFDLPQWGASSSGYLFYGYSGTVLEEVEVGQYFVDHLTDVKLRIRNIRTN